MKEEITTLDYKNITLSFYSREGSKLLQACGKQRQMETNGHKGRQKLPY